MNAMVQPFKELGQIKVAALIGAAVVLIGFFIFVSMRVAAPMMSPLFTNLPTEEGAKIMQELDQRNIPYELRSGGTQIMVPSDQVNKLRLVMAEQGIPSRGSVVGYEIFDKTDSMGTSNFVLNLNQLRALEGELARTITDFQAVEQARVHLVMPKRELFTRDTVEPTASVALKLRAAGGLEKSEIAAIRHLVATAVPGLKPQRVTIVDSRGALLAKGVDEENDKNVLTEEAEDFRVVYEKRLAETIERLLERSIGHGKVKAEVHADIDFDRTITNSEKYDPEGQVARSIQSITENEKSNERSMDQTVSVANQLPDANAASGGAGSNAESNRGRTEETTNFEISKQVINSVKETGNVKRLSVAVLVDGVYSKNAEGDEVYNPRSAEDLEKLRQLVNSAIGFDEKRGDEVEVVNLQFAAPDKDVFEDDGMGWLKDDLNSIIQTLVLGGVAILAILMVIRPLVARAIESAEASQREDELEQAALAAPSIAARLTDQSRLSEDDVEDAPEEEMINIDRIQGKVKSSSYNKINGMVEKHPEETLQIIRQWLIS